MDNISQQVLLVCLRYVIKLDGHTPSVKFKVDQLRNWYGLQMVLYVLELVVMVMSFLVKLLINRWVITTGRLI